MRSHGTDEVTLNRSLVGGKKSWMDEAAFAVVVCYVKDEVDWSDHLRWPKRKLLQWRGHQIFLEHPFIFAEAKHSNRFSFGSQITLLSATFKWQQYLGSRNRKWKQSDTRVGFSLIAMTHARTAFIETSAFLHALNYVQVVRAISWMKKITGWQIAKRHLLHFHREWFW